ncbi:MAG: LysM peptidoglycan-binding domain-containing protein [Thermodesulfobacteriota bacterium]
MPEYTVKQGDCLSSIGEKYGIFWEKIWNQPKNDKLKEKRKNPNILYPGDVIFIPDTIKGTVLFTIKGDGSVYLLNKEKPI